LGEYLHELTIFPNGKYDDQADSTSQALDWVKSDSRNLVFGLNEFWRREEERMIAEQQAATGVKALLGL